MTLFGPLISKLHLWISGWAQKSLPMVGRLQLLKFSVWPFLLHWFKATLIPCSIIHLIRKLCAKFLDHGSLDHKLHTIAWLKVASPMEKGGLGIICPSKPLTSCKIFLCWLILCNISLLTTWWKSNRLRINNSSAQLNKAASPFWKSLSKTAGLLTQFISFDCSRNFYLFQLKAVFTFKDAHILQFLDWPDVPWSSSLWIKGVKLKYKCIIWKVLNGGLKMADILRIRGINCSSLCHLCITEEGSHSHLFFQCDFAFHILQKVQPRNRGYLFPLFISQIICDTTSLYVGEKRGILSALGLSLGGIWKERNARLFNNSKTNIACIISNIKLSLISLIKNWKQFKDSEFFSQWCTELSLRQ